MKKAEIVKEIKSLGVAKVYANEDNGCYGDIFNTKQEVLECHPGAKVLEGYVVIDINSGYCPNESKDWHDTLEEAEDEAWGLLPF